MKNGKRIEWADGNQREEKRGVKEKRKVAMSSSALMWGCEIVGFWLRVLCYYVDE